MVKLVIKPTELHETFWSKIDSSIFAMHLNVPPREREKITMQLLHIALESIMLSVPITDNGAYDDFLAPFIDQANMHEALMAVGLVETPFRVNQQRQRVLKSALMDMRVGHDVSTKTAYESNRVLANLAFGKENSAFIQDVENLVVGSFCQFGKEFNPYLEYNIKAHTEPNGLIFGFEVVFGDDVRHTLYRRVFPGGRYDPLRVNEICDVQDLSGNSEA